MKIVLRIGDDLVAGELYDNPVADQVADLLPFAAGFDDFHAQEKLTRLPRALDVSGVPRADEPRPGEIGYYAPGLSLVLYYASPGRWPGLVRIGRFDLPLERLRALPGGTRIEIAAAEQ
ncbi:cyclophilin-like fold protein [Streptomyces sp. NPDC001777]|uniref:cyclophilin-like fold protein n=1 Tax=Streptomyces sp. NPDC001777 TaxID=3364608 RepID=UPI0036AAB3E2